MARLETLCSWLVIAAAVEGLPNRIQEVHSVYTLNDSKALRTPAERNCSDAPLVQDPRWFYNHDVVSPGQNVPEASNVLCLDPWCSVWYVGSFAALILFFVAVSCTDCCCTRMRGTDVVDIRSIRRPLPQPRPTPQPPPPPPPPPPPYQLFAPPSYGSLLHGDKELEIYVIPLHEEVPPPAHTATPLPPPT